MNQLWKGWKKTPADSIPRTKASLFLRRPRVQSSGTELSTDPCNWHPGIPPGICLDVSSKSLLGMSNVLLARG